MTRTLFSQLDDEWSSLLHSTRWRRFRPHLIADDRLRNLADGDPTISLRRLGSVRPVAADRAFVALIELGRSQPLAQRTVLQTIVPGLCPIAGCTTTATNRDDLWERSEALVSIAALRVVTYPIDGRPRHVAGNMLLDIRRDFYRERDLRWPDVPLDDGPEDLTDRGPADVRADYSLDLVDHRAELTSIIADATAKGKVSDRDLAVLISTRVFDAPVRERAVALGVTRDTLLRSRHRTEQRLRDIAVAQRREAASAVLTAA